MKKHTTASAGYPEKFDEQNFHALCDLIAARDKDLHRVLKMFGYPPMWTRANTFETIVHIILEQQVSLASALAALNKLKEKLTTITPEKTLSLSDEEIRACFVSRQKSGYIRGLAAAIKSGEIKLVGFAKQTDNEVRQKLIQLKGIGNWTIDVYLMFVLQRTDIFPIGDLAAVNAMKRLKHLDPKTPREEILTITEQWQPLRTIACMILWHYYLSDTGKKIAPVK